MSESKGEENSPGSIRVMRMRSATHCIAHFSTLARWTGWRKLFACKWLSSRDEPRPNRAHKPKDTRAEAFKMLPARRARRKVSVVKLREKV